MKRITILIILMSGGLISKSQDLNRHTDFFVSKIPEFKEWLIHSNLADVITFDTIKVKDNRLDLMLNCYDKSRNVIADKANLDSLNSKLQRLYLQNYGEILFEKLIFLMDLEKEQARIEINCNDVIVIITMREGELKTFPMTKMGEIADGHRIAIGDIKGINKTGSASVNETITAIRTKLITELKKEFSQYEVIFEDYVFEIFSELNNELIIEISNVAKLVIKDQSYFEHIRIQFKFTPVDDEMKIDYTIRAKYGSGIIWTPKNSDYYDMTPKYQDDLEKFSTKLKNRIDNILKN